MRRDTPGVKFRDKLLSERIETLERDDPERVIATLERFVNEGRRRRIQEVISKRLESVTVAEVAEIHGLGRPFGERHVRAPALEERPAVELGGLQREVEPRLADIRAQRDDLEQ